MADQNTLAFANAFENLNVIPLNNQLLSTIMNDVKELKKEAAKDKDKTIILEFTGEDRLNASMTAKALGIKQTELDKIVEDGALMPYSSGKMIFRASEVLKYINKK